jgi:hypothetical protein
VTLDPASIEAIAVRVVELLRDEQSQVNGLVDARTVAEGLGTSRDFVYSHRGQLGAVQLGTGSKPRLRFDLAKARAAYAAISAPTKRPAPKRRSRARRKHVGAPLLPIGPGGTR